MAEEQPRDRDRVCVGVIVGAHGIRGQVRVKSFTADPEHLDGYGPLSDDSGAQSFAVGVVGRSKGVVICTLPGIDDRTAAERLKGTRLYLDRALLPALEEDEFYHSDLVGLTARFADGTEVGTVAALYDFGAGDVMEIRGAAGGAVMVPFTRDSVPSVDLEGGVVIVAPMPGLLEGPVKPGSTGARRRSAGRRHPGKGEAEPATPEGGRPAGDRTDGERPEEEWPDEDWPDEDWRDA
jgi:16S rRNA processing protein RimM